MSEADKWRYRKKQIIRWKAYLWVRSQPDIMKRIIHEAEQQLAMEKANPRKPIEIFEADDNWKPTGRLVYTVLRQMAKKGLRADWQFCFTTKFHDLIFCDGDTSDSIEARRRAKRWSFFTDSGHQL